MVLDLTVMRYMEGSFIYIFFIQLNNKPLSFLLVRDLATVIHVLATSRLGYFDSGCLDLSVKFRRKPQQEK